MLKSNYSSEYMEIDSICNAKDINFYNNYNNNNLAVSQNSINISKLILNFYSNVNNQNNEGIINKINSNNLLSLIKSKTITSSIINYECKLCNKKFKKPSSLGGHTSRYHKGESLVKHNNSIKKRIRKGEIKRGLFYKTML